jgi:hypothetical protein
VAPIGSDASRVSLVTVVPLTLTNIGAAAGPAASTAAPISDPGPRLILRRVRPKWFVRRDDQMTATKKMQDRLSRAPRDRP